MEHLTILVADDHWIARSAISGLLHKLASKVEMLEAENIDEAFNHLNQRPDIELIVLDLNMPGRKPIDSIALIRQEAPMAKIVVMSVSENRSDVLRSLEEGAVGYVPKTALPEAILDTFRRVLEGEVALPQRLLVADNPGEDASLADDQDIARIGVAFEEFTPRQREIFMLLAGGLNNKELADMLGLSVNTVRVHMQAIGSKLKTSNRSTLTLQAARWRDRGAA